jgi:hypothetical protein
LKGWLRHGGDQKEKSATGDVALKLPPKEDGGVH